MPACAPVSETAGTPSACSAMAVSAMVCCSPVASSMSISRSLGSGAMSLASLMRPSVTPLIADTTTTTWSPRERYSATRARDVFDAVGVAHRGAAVFLDNQSHDELKNARMPEMCRQSSHVTLNQIRLELLVIRVHAVEVLRQFQRRFHCRAECPATSPSFFQFPPEISPGWRFQ